MATVAHLYFFGQVRVDMIYACPKDVKNMLLKQARSSYWNKWEAKHECEELKEGTLPDKMVT